MLPEMTFPVLVFVIWPLISVITVFVLLSIRPVNVVVTV